MTVKTSALLMLMTLSACAAQASAVDETAPDLVEQRPYPRAQWRVDPSSLNQVAFSLRRLVISHRESAPLPREFYPDHPTQRSRDQAIALAREVHARLVEAPDEFAELARRYSDDSRTRIWGGELGLVRATMVAENVVDALDVLREGEISEPIDTPHGYQLIQRLPIPDAQAITGRAIYIRHSELGDTQARPRWQARELAAQAAATAQLGADFGRLFARWGEQPERTEEGSLGSLNMHAATSDALLAHVLARTPVGQSSGPVETRAGFAIVQRTAPQCIDRLQTVELVFPHRDSRLRGPATTRTRADAAAEAEAARPTFETVSDFGALQEMCDRSGCRVEHRSWDVGTRAAHLESAVRRLGLGLGHAATVETEAGFFLLRHLPTAPELVNTLSFEAPQPKAQTFADLLPDTSGPYLANLAIDSAAAFLRERKLDAKTTDRVTMIMRSFADELATSIDSRDRLRLMRAAREKLSAVLGNALLSDYEGLLDRRLAYIQRHL